MWQATFASFTRVAAVAAIFAVGSPALTCEDVHPPIVTTPRGEFVARDNAGKQVVTLAIDPRGIGGVVPIGEPANTWIDRDDPTGAWHYREWQWWQGHPWGDSCRPRYYSDVQLKLRPQQSETATVSYRIDGFECRQVFLMPSVAEQNAPYWDIVTTVRNVSGRDVQEYGQFFACYTPLNRGRSFWFWDESNQLVKFADRNVKHLDGYIVNPQAYFLERAAIPHCPRGGGKIVGRWHHPMIVSQASPGGWRSVVLLESTYTASLAQGIEGGAMDYILFPSPNQPNFANGAEFSAHIRHVMLKSHELPTSQRLQKLWNDFDHSHAATHKRAAPTSL